MEEQIRILREEVECLRKLYALSEEQRKSELKARIAGDAYAKDLLSKLENLQQIPFKHIRLCDECKRWRSGNAGSEGEGPCRCGSVSSKLYHHMAW